MILSPGFVSAAFYHALTPSAVLSAVPRLLMAFNGAARGSNLLRYVFSELQTPLSMPTEPLDEGALKRLTAAFMEARLRSVEFRERGKRTWVAPAHLRFSLVPKRSARRPVEVPFEILAFFPGRVVASTNALVRALSEIAEMLGASYAFIHVGRNAEWVRQEAWAMAASNFYVEPSPEEREWAGRLDHIQMHRDVLGSERIRGAYWGTFLGPHFVERLGGLDRVSASAPVEKVEALWSGMAYLQLTDDVWDYKRSDFAEKIASLERYLEPISLLSLERIPTPRFAKWDRGKPT